MLVTQMCFDLLQIVSALPRFFVEPHYHHLLLRPLHLFLGAAVIDVVEYSAHRLMHANRQLRKLHKRHRAVE